MRLWRGMLLGERCLAAFDLRAENTFVLQHKSADLGRGIKSARLHAGLPECFQHSQFRVRWHNKNDFIASMKTGTAAVK